MLSSCGRAQLEAASGAELGLRAKDSREADLTHSQDDAPCMWVQGQHQGVSPASGSTEWGQAPGGLPGRFLIPFLPRQDRGLEFQNLQPIFPLHVSSSHAKHLQWQLLAQST